MTGRIWTDAEESHLRKWAGIKTAAEIGADIGRTEEAVFKRMGRLKLPGIKRGEKHRLAKIKRTGALMLRLLGDAGYQPADIYTLFQQKPSLRIVQDVCAGRTWKHAK